MKCRLCLIECHKENEVSLFSNEIETNLTKLIAKYLYIKVTQEDSFSTIICKDCVRHLNDFHDFYQLVEEQQQVLQKEFHEVECIANDNGNGSENHDESLLDMNDVLVEGELYPEERLLIDEFDDADEHLNNIAGSDEENIPLQCLRRKIVMNYKIQHAGRDKPKHACKICNKKFQHLSKLNHHMIAHKPTAECPTCGKWYALNSLKYHIKIHKLEESKCEKCGKTFKSKLALSKHVNNVHGKKIFSCTYCKKKFKRSWELKEHVALHTGRKDYNCKYCRREFRWKAHMYAHIKKIHVEEWEQAQLDRKKGPSPQVDKKIEEE